MAAVTIRRAREDEAADLTRLMLRSKALWGYDEAFMRAAATELRITAEDIRDRDVLVAEGDGVVIGVAAVEHRSSPPELDALFVDPTATGAGAGKALLQAALAAAAARGVAELAIASDPNAEPFYLAHGARRTGVERSPSTGRELPLLVIPTPLM